MKFLSTLIIVLFISPICANSLDVLVKNSNGRPIADIVVYIESNRPISEQIRANKVEINQKNKAFSPYITVVQKDQPVVFNNQDDITHHIYSASRHQRFSFKIKAGQVNSDIVFNQAGIISMGCNIHDWMSGYLLVLNTAVFSKTNALGIAHFKNLNSNNKVKVKIWHPQLNEKKRDTQKTVELSVQQEIIFSLKEKMTTIEPQESGDDFDFLDDY